MSRQFGTAIDILRALKASGQLSETVVVHMGTNGVITQGHMDAIMDILKDRKRVVFVNLKVPRRWEQTGQRRPRGRTSRSTRTRC